MVLAADEGDSSFIFDTKIQCEFKPNSVLHPPSRWAGLVTGEGMV